MNKVGLVLEGGGMRGLYTAGVLDCFMKNNLYLPYIIGVSAGACNAASYVSKQIGRNKRVNTTYVENPEYLSYRNIFKQKSFFGMDYLFDEIPNKLDIFDFKTFNSAKEEFIIGTTNCITGEPVYFSKNQCNILKVLRASSSLPFWAPIVKYEENEFLDGAISDPIPIRKSISDGNEKNIIVLTRNKGYRKEPFKMRRLAKLVYPKYEGLVNAMITRHNLYNETLDYIETLEKQEKALVIRPSQLLKVNRLEKNKQKLIELYEQGIQDTEKILDEIKKFVK